MPSLFLPDLGFGLITASVLAIAAVGLTLQFGVTNFVNFAYGEFMTLGAYLTYVFNVGLHLNIWVALVIGSLLSAVAGFAINRLVIRPFVRRRVSLFILLVVTIGLSLFLENGIQAIWGPNFQKYVMHAGSSFKLGSMIWTVQELVIIGIAALMMIGVHLILKYTRLGRSMRAMSDNSDLARISGIPVVRMLDGREARYEVALPVPGEEKRAILETYTKEHSAEYQAQAVIDIAFRLRKRIADPESIDEVVIRTSRHTHDVIGTGSGDPQKLDPDASRETLDHSVMYIFATAFIRGEWHHETSYAQEARRDPAVAVLWPKVRTEVSEEWERRYHSARPEDRAFGATVEVRLSGGRVEREELAVANAHPNGARPFALTDYIRKLERLTDGIVDETAAEGFLEAVRRLPDLDPEELHLLTPVAPAAAVEPSGRPTKGIF